MLLPLYSKAHLEEAKVLLPEKLLENDWFNAQWTTDEINQCKEWAYQDSVLKMSKPEYEKFIGLEPMDEQNQEVADYVIGAIPNKEAKILSIGCGYGDKEIYLSRKGYDVTALDNSPIMGMLRSRYAGEVNFISQADARALPLPDDSFDFIMMLNVIYAIPNPDLGNLFAEFHRVLKKGGGFIISSSATLGAAEKIREKLKKLSQLLVKKERSVKAGQSQKQTGWLRDRREVEKYLPYKDYKSIRYHGSLCIGMKYRNTVKHNLLRLLSKVWTLDSYYDVWVAKGRK